LKFPPPPLPSFPLHAPKTSQPPSPFSFFCLFGASINCNVLWKWIGITITPPPPPSLSSLFVEPKPGYAARFCLRVLECRFFCFFSSPFSLFTTRPRGRERKNTKPPAPPPPPLFATPNCCFCGPPPPPPPPFPLPSLLLRPLII